MRYMIQIISVTWFYFFYSWFDHDDCWMKDNWAICMKKMVDLWERIIFYYTCDMERMSERGMPISLIICDLLKDVRLICQPWWVMGLP